jgi:hypothetical protein
MNVELLKRNAVIPREGVESIAGGTYYYSLEIEVIPREGVERIWCGATTREERTACDPERGS